MKPFALAICLAFVVIYALASCGGPGRVLDSKLQDDSQAMASGGNSLAGLPSLNDLPEPPREASLQGPGWLELHPKSTVVREGGRPSLPGEIVLEAAGQTAYAIYGVRNFDGNCFPTSVRLQLEDASGEYYVGFSDYIAGSWRFTQQWTGSATIEIPDIDDYSSPFAYVSEHGWHYFVIVIPDGGGMTISGVEVGVHGGTQGPRRPLGLQGDGGENGLLVSWMHSPDYLRPDFAGYILERAPWFGGDFTRLTPQPLMGTNFLDATAEVDTKYRYRIAAIDASGNMSPWLSSVIGPEYGELADPVVVVDNLPRGPLYAPIEVTFDLSGSYDPEGDALVNYRMSILGSPVEYNGPDPMIAVTLQPGTYGIVLSCSTGPRTGRTFFPLVVYPRWRDSSVVVRDPELINWTSRLDLMRGGRVPSTGRIVLFGYDSTFPGAALWSEQPSENNFRLFPMPSYANPTAGRPGVSYVGEPVTFGNRIFFPTCASSSFMLASFDGNSPEWTYLWESTANPYVAAATDSDNDIWLFFEVDDGGTFRLDAYSVYHPDFPAVVVDDLNEGLRGVDAVYNHSSGMVDVVYIYADAGVDYVRWVQWDPVTQTPDLTSPVTSGDSCSNVDVELDPLTSKSTLVVWRDGGASRRNVFSRQEGVALWTIPEVIDDSGDNREAVDLVYCDNDPYVYFGLEAGPVHLYDCPGGIWDVRNTPGLTDGGWDLVLLDNPANDDLVVADRNFDGNIFIDDLHADGTDTVRSWALIGTDSQGFEMHGAPGADGLHVIWQSIFSWAARHYVSPDGETWADAGNLPGVPGGLDLTTTADGDIYCSLVDSFTGFASLRWWDGASFVLQESLDNCSTRYRPILSRNPEQDNVTWIVDQDAPPHTLHYYEGNADVGFIDAPTVLDDFPIWNGVYLSGGIGVDPVFPALAGGGAMDEGDLGFIRLYGNELNLLASPLTDYPLNFLAAQECLGRNIAGATYADFPLGLTAQAYWFSHGSFMYPVRYVIKHPLAGDSELVDLPVGGSYFQFDARRTVSAATAWGPTAVGLISNLGGSQTYFEWSNFGDWEELDLPELEYMTMPELIVGRDGRWHIVYKNYLTDQIMCRSTR